MEDLGLTNKILGMEIKRQMDKGILTLTQCTYTEKLLRKFNMEDSKAGSPPIGGNFKMSSAQSPKTEKDIEGVKIIPYSNATESLMYAMIFSRPDLACSILVSRFMSNLGKDHQLAVKCIFRCPKGTKTQGLIYGDSAMETNGIIGYVDFNFTGDLDKRRSLTRYVFTIHESLVSWNYCQLQLYLQQGENI